MDKKIRKMQLDVLEIFSLHSKSFALSGGTALELFYLGHRFSKDLDFFSPEYNIKEIDFMVSKFRENLNVNITLENEFFIKSNAKVRFYVMPVKGCVYPLKLDFVEDVLIENPTIKKINKIPVYDVREIYFQKVIAITGARIIEGITGKDEISGRNEVRDVIDLYYLSKKTEPLHNFLERIPGRYQRGIIHWYRTYSRQEFKLGYLDYEVYDKKLHSKEIISHMDNEIKIFVGEAIK